MIVLLDLNYTLVANSDEKKSPFTRQIEGEEYRVDLIESLVGHIVCLVTARPGKYRDRTLRSIHDKTGWLPSYSYFNPSTRLTPPMAKERYLDKILSRFGKAREYVAIESNPKTRAMYAKRGIRAITYQEFVDAGYRF
jgi:hypothetical protein